MDHRSVSQLTEWDRCREAYRLRRVEKVTPVPATWSIHGTAFHRAAEWWEKGRRQAPAAQVREIFGQCWDEELVSAREREPDLSRWLASGRKSAERDLDDRRAEGEEQAGAYAAFSLAEGLRPVEINGEPAVELRFDWEVSGITVTGFADLILLDRDGRFLLRDLKTGRRPAWPLQLIIYAHALADTHDLGIRWGDWYLAKQGIASEPFDLSCIPGGPIVRWLADMDAEQKEGRYRPSRGDACRTCDVQRCCSFFAM